MNQINLKVKSMFWYKKTGRIIYLILFSISLISTIIQGVNRKPHFLSFIFVDVTIALLGLWLEAALIHLSQLGTIYIETSRYTKSFKLKERLENNENYYVGDTREDYVVNVEGAAYTKNYKKTETILEENPDIEIPLVEITTIEKISKAAGNEYSLFGIAGETNKTENVKIIVTDKEKDIRRV